MLKQKSAQDFEADRIEFAFREWWHMTALHEMTATEARVSLQAAFDAAGLQIIVRE